MDHEPYASDDCSPGDHDPDQDQDHEHDPEHDSPLSSTRSLDPHHPETTDADATNAVPAARPARNPAVATIKNGREPKRRRACEACRRLKVQCNFDSSKSDICKRCLKANRECVVLERRRRQVVANSVSELEKKLEALTATLKAIKASPDHVDQDETTVRDAAVAAAATTAAVVAKVKSAAAAAAAAGSTAAARNPAAGVPTADQVDHNAGDVIDRGIIDHETAISVFNHFLQHMLPQLPVLVVPPGTTAMAMRQTQPVLFLAILSAGAWILTIPNQRTINEELNKLLSYRILFVGEKSLELIQAIQVCSAWHFPPNKFEELKYYQYIHSAGVMAIDMGLSKRGPPKHNQDSSPRIANNKQGPKRVFYPDASSIEARRAWLVCFILGSLSAQNFRRENIIRYSSFIDESVTVLETSPEASQSDEILCQWVRLQHIVDDVGVQFCIEDPTSSDKLGASQIRFAMQGFESQLKKCMNQQMSNPKNSSLKLAELNTRLYMHEVALHAGYNCNDDMQPPFTEEDLACIRPTQAKELSAAHIQSLSSCLVTIHSIFDTFLGMPVDECRNTPTFHYVRFTYATIALVKLAFDTTFPESEIGKMFSLEDFKVDHYCEKMAAHLLEITTDKYNASANRVRRSLVNLQGLLRRLLVQKGVISTPLSEAKHNEQHDVKPHRMVSVMPTERSPPQHPPQWVTAAPPQHMLSAGHPPGDMNNAHFAMAHGHDMTPHPMHAVGHPPPTAGLMGSFVPAGSMMDDGSGYAFGLDTAGYPAPFFTDGYAMVHQSNDMSGMPNNFPTPWTQFRNMPSNE